MYCTCRSTGSKSLAIHCICYPGPIKKVCWIILTLVAFSGLIYNLTMVSLTYASYPVSVGISIQHASDVQFPAITLCNMSPVRLSAVEDNSLLGGSGITTSSRNRKRRKRSSIGNNYISQKREPLGVQVYRPHSLCTIFTLSYFQLLLSWTL